MPVSESSVTPIQVGVKGSSYLRCIGRSKKLERRCHHTVSSSWTDAENYIFCPLDKVKVGCSLVNMPLSNVNAGLILCSRPKSWRHLCKENFLAEGGMSDKSLWIFLDRLEGNHKN